jgi:hypothetical protein
MRKAVLLLINSVTLLAMIIIGLVFQRAEIYNETIYVEKIRITNIRIGNDYIPTYFDEAANLYRVLDEADPTKSFMLTFFEGLRLDLIYEVVPNTASFLEVSFFCDPNSTIAQIDAITGRVTFLDSGTETFTIRATDNSNVNARIRIRSRSPL